MGCFLGRSLVLSLTEEFRFRLGKQQTGNTQFEGSYASPHGTGYCMFHDLVVDAQQLLLDEVGCKQLLVGDASYKHFALMISSELIHSSLVLIVYHI